MTDPLYSDLSEIFREVMDRSDLTVGPSTTAADVEQWDSLTHVLLIVAVEKRFKVRFSATEVQQLQNVGELAALIQRHAEAK